MCEVTKGDLNILATHPCENRARVGHPRLESPLIESHQQSQNIRMGHAPIKNMLYRFVRLPNRAPNRCLCGEGSVHAASSP